MKFLGISFQNFSLPTCRRFSVNTSNCLKEKFLVEKYLPLNLNPSDEEKANNISKLHSIYKSTEFSIEDILESKLGLSKDIITKVMSKLSDKVDPISLSRNIDLMKKYMDISHLKSDVSNFAFCLKKNHISFSHSLGTLKEMGLPINLKYIKRGNIWCSHHTVRSLRDKRIIPPDKDIIRNVFISLSAPQQILDSIPTYYEGKKMRELSSECLKILLMWLLEHEPNYSQMAWSYLTHRSLAQIFRNFTLLKESFHFTLKKIMLYPTLLIGNPDSYLDFLKYQDKICGVCPLELINIHPSTLRFPLQRILRTEKLLEYVNGNTVSPSNLARLMARTNEQTLSRIEFFLRKTSLTDFRLTPNNIFLLSYFVNCSKKLAHHEKQFGSLEKTIPDEILVQGTSVSRKSGVPTRFRHIRQFLELFVGLDKSRSHEIFYETRLSALPDLATLKENYTFLVNQGFDLGALMEAPHILLYHPTIVTVCHQDLRNTKYGPLYYQNKDFRKLLQLFHCKVHRMSITFGKIL